MSSLSLTNRFRWATVPVICLIILSLFSPTIASGYYQDEEPLPTVEATPVAETGAPIIVNDRELFRLHTRVGSITASERAALVSDRISQLANNPFIGDLDVSVIDVQGATDIVVGEEILITVSETDATVEGSSRQELAQEWATLIQAAIAEGQAGSSTQALAAGVGITLFVLLGLVLINWLINRVGLWLTDKLDPTTESGRLPRTLVESEFYQSGLYSRSMHNTLRLLKLLLAIFLITVALPFILLSFPQTHTLGVKVGRLLLDPLAEMWDGFVTFLPDLASLLVLGILTWIAIRLVRLFFREIERGVIRVPSFEPEWAGLTGRIVIIIIIVVAVIIGFTSLPVSQLPVFQGVSAFLALLFTLASSSAIANIIAGIILTYTGAFRLGDIIEIQSKMGEVVGKHLLTTRVRTFKNEVVSFPNSLVLSNSVTNYTRLARENGLTLHTEITIGYDVPWQQVHELLIAAALDSQDILKRPAPFVLQTSLNDFHVSYELNAFTHKPERLPRLYSAIHQNIQMRFNAAGVEIMSPAFAALRDGNAITIPPGFSQMDGRPPADEDMQMTGNSRPIIDEL